MRLREGKGLHVGLPWRFALFCAALARVSTGAYFNITSLRLSYASVSDWARFTPPADVRTECTSGAPLRVVFFTRHTGTLWDWVAVAAHVGVPWTRVNPGLFQPYGLNASGADRIWRQVGHIMCNMGDILVFSDTIPDARPLLQGGCRTPIILQVTNRFDYGVLQSDLREYVALMSRAAERPHVWWVTNNPYEEEYMARRGLTLPSDRKSLLRPVGTCLLPEAAAAAEPAPGPDGGGAAEDAAAAAAAEDAKLVALILPPYQRHLENTFLLPWMLKRGLTDHVKVYRQHYGGPSVLARHRGVITVPYQTSVMKMYEGLAAGAVFIIPGPTLFAAMVRDLDLHQMSFCCRELLRDHPDGWARFMDWYHDDFVSAHILYDDLRQLSRIIKDVSWSSQLVEQKRAAGLAAMAASRERTLDGYSSLMRAVSQQACAATQLPNLVARGLAMSRSEPRGAAAVAAAAADGQQGEGSSEGVAAAAAVAFAGALTAAAAAGDMDRGE